jgi:hypothetical protein
MGAEALRRSRTASGFRLTVAAGPARPAAGIFEDAVAILLLGRRGQRLGLELATVSVVGHPTPALDARSAVADRFPARRDVRP